jgi:hypothetical protein
MNTSANRRKQSDRLRTRRGVAEQRCRECGEWKPLSLKHYAADNHSYTGYETRCRECRRAKDRQRGSRSQPYVSTSVPDDGPHYRLTFGARYQASGVAPYQPGGWHMPALPADPSVRL